MGERITKLFGCGPEDAEYYVESTGRFSADNSGITLTGEQILNALANATALQPDADTPQNPQVAE